MNAFTLKLIAIFSMVVGHIGFFFFPENTVLFAIGRIAFPTFAFLIANGARHTKNIWHYLLRLFIFAFLSQIPFILANRMVDPQYWRLNILFTLTLGLLCIIVLQKARFLFFKIVALIIIGILAVVFQVDYGMVGVFAVIISYLLYNKKKWLLVSLAALLLGYYGYQFLIAISYGLISEAGMRLLPFSLLVLIPIWLYDGKRGYSLKYTFYLFYPLHYLVIYALLS